MTKYCPRSRAGICVITPTTPLYTSGADAVLLSTCLHWINPTAAMTLAELFKPPYWRCSNYWKWTTVWTNTAITGMSTNGGKTDGTDVFYKSCSSFIVNSCVRH